MSYIEPRGTSEQEPLLTVIVPVYNAMPYLVELLDSLVAQSLHVSDFDVLLVDDGSTDDGPAIMDEYAANRPNFSVLHEENSGWPGKPRNTGLELARTKYVFFADSDDIVAPTALQLMVEYAEEEGSDIVIPQLVGMEKRKVPSMGLTEPTPKLDLEAAFHTLGPIKLYRNSLLKQHGINFPTEKVRLEDGIFNARAYLVAGRISVMAGEDLYYVRSRDDGLNISVQAFEPFGYTGSVAKMCRVINDGDLKESTRREIVLGLFQRKCLKIYRPGRFLKYRKSRRLEWVAAHRSFIEEFVTPEMERHLRHPYDIRTRLIRAGDVEALERLQRLEAIPALRADLVEVDSKGDGMEWTMDITCEGALDIDQLACELRSREGNGHAAFSLRATNGSPEEYASPRRFRGVISSDALSDLIDGTYDLYATRLVGKKHISERIVAANASSLASSPETRAYATEHGNLSLKKSSRIPAPAMKSVSPARRWVGWGIRKSRALVVGIRRGR